MSTTGQALSRLLAQYPSLRAAVERGAGGLDLTADEQLEIRRGRWHQRTRLLRPALAACGVPRGLLDARADLTQEQVRPQIEQAGAGGLWRAVGPNGVGKSAWSVLVLCEFLTNRITQISQSEEIDIDLPGLERGEPDFHGGCVWTRLAWITEEIQQAIADNRTKRDVLDRYRGAQWLAVDDVLAGNMTEAAAGVLFDIIDRRSLDGLPTVVTMDGGLRDLESRLGEHGARACSRLQRFCVVRFTGPDRRRAERGREGVASTVARFPACVGDGVD